MKGKHTIERFRAFNNGKERYTTYSSIQSVALLRYLRVIGLPSSKRMALYEWLCVLYRAQSEWEKMIGPADTTCKIYGFKYDKTEGETEQDFERVRHIFPALIAVGCARRSAVPDGNVE